MTAVRSTGRSASLNLDANATLGVIPEVWKELLQLGDLGLNPSSVHRGGQRARALLEEAREEVGLFLGLGTSDHLVFTSGATEANCAVVHTARALCLSRGAGYGIVTTAFEHPSILEAVERCEQDGVPVAVVEGPLEGLCERMAETLGADGVLISCMAANNETGTLLPLSAVVGACRATAGEGVLVHSDLVQVAGKLPLSFRALGVDFGSVSGHKIGALPGIGALVMSERGAESFRPLLVGGPQELKTRAGTENILGAFSFGLAARLARQGLEARVEMVRRARDLFESSLRAALGGAVRIHDFGRERLPNTVSVHFPGLRADDLVVALDRVGVYVSSGAACSSGKPQSSHVLRAFGLSEEVARETVRISFPCMGDLPDPVVAVERIVNAVQKMKNG